ncbi:Transient receptor potential channel pyrexia [Eumeta japonica]|uniref:Transient receptor potential channel pyrexia n=1 Tax=Eumeta variegata TaxID=151549 RepID=A0A4C1SQ55_EUMVA|nr:Transient receptor potential channel pyrexia [Eumeta japonica]
MNNLAEDSSDLEAGYISSDESGHGPDLAERLRVKPSRDIWELDDIKRSLYRLENAEELSPMIQSGLYEEVISSATALQSDLKTVGLWACWLGRSALLAKLLRLGLDANSADDAGRTCLHLSCLVGSEECVKLLLAYGANPNRWDSDNDETNATPLHCAASAKSLPCVKILMAHGADVNAGLKEHSPLHYAVLSDASEVVSELLKAGACPDTPQVFTETPLHVAASLGSAECTRLLLEAGADVRAAMGPSKATALHLAAEDGHAECAQLLLDHGACIDRPNSRRQTPLHLAALAQSVEVVELLVSRRANVRARDDDGRTPLHRAVVRGARSCDVVHALLNAGADPNEPDDFGYTPLHIAALIECSACVLLLLDYGGDVTLRTKGGVSVLSFIVRRVPEVVPRYLAKLDDAVHVSEHELGDVDCELTVDFRSLVPCLSRGESELLMAFIEIPHGDINDEGKSKNTSNWQHDVAAITVFFCWLELMFIIGRFPTFGMYVQMFTTVTFNFATFLMAYSCLLMAFGLAFSVLFSNYPAFHLPASVVKTVMMMSGELEYEDIFYNNDTNSQLQYPVTAHVMFLIFVLLVTVILTNLLVGLAVSDIQALQESACLDRLVRQTQLVAHLESMLFSRLLDCAPKQLVAVLRWGAVLTYRIPTICIRPNDPRENKIPKDLIASIYKVAASKKDTKRSIRKVNNYEFRVKKCKEEEEKDNPVVKRKSNLFDRYSTDSQQVERRKRTTSSSLETNRQLPMTINAIQEICMVDIKNQLADISKRINKLTETNETRLNAMESKLIRAYRLSKSRYRIENGTGSKTKAKTTTEIENETWSKLTI